MKALKRNAVILTVLLFVGAAVYLNWAYNKNEENADEVLNAAYSEQQESSADTETETDEAGLYFEEHSQETTSNLSQEQLDYFSTARLTRQQARDSALTALETASQTEAASQETIDEALAAVTAMSGWTSAEAELESLIIAKGFEDCVVYVSEDGISVMVPSEETGLSSAAVARITDVVTSETGMSAQQLKIIEVK
jgi:stage III sporulation protein AH